MPQLRGKRGGLSSSYAQPCVVLLPMPCQPFVKRAQSDLAAVLGPRRTRSLEAAHILARQQERDPLLAAGDYHNTAGPEAEQARRIRRLVGIVVEQSAVEIGEQQVE